MNCPRCGATLPSGVAFCPECGTPVAPPTDASFYPQPTVTPVATAPRPVAHKSGLSTGTLVAIIAGALVFLLLLGAGGVVLVRGIAGRSAKSAEVAPPVAPAEAEQVEDGETGEAADAQVPAIGRSEQPAPQDGVITDQMARDTVTAFMDARMDRDVSLSNSYCTPQFLDGEWADLLKDETWRPDGYEIVNSAPDLMFVHVVVLEQWPSGQEHWIYSVFLDPNSGRPLIDGTLDPANVPELIP